MYQIKVRTNDTTDWSTPFFPKCSKTIDDARRDANIMIHAYDHVAIVKDGKIIEEVNIGVAE